MATKPPCYGCERRELGCHGRCAEYAAWRKAKDEENEAIARERKTDNALSEFIFLKNVNGKIQRKRKH